MHGLDGTTPDPDALAARHQAALDEAPVDIAVLGLGRDGHVAFDEPGSPADSGVRRVVLTDLTRRDAAAAFGGIDNVPTRGAHGRAAHDPRRQGRPGPGHRRG